MYLSEVVRKLICLYAWW